MSILHGLIDFSCLLHENVSSTIDLESKFLKSLSSLQIYLVVLFDKWTWNFVFNNNQLKSLYIKYLFCQELLKFKGRNNFSFEQDLNEKIVIWFNKQKHRKTSPLSTWEQTSQGVIFLYVYSCKLCSESVRVALMFALPFFL